MGDWIYYSTFLRFIDVVSWIKTTEEVHANPKLSERIQRQLNGRHATDISTYLCTDPQRFFNSLVVGVYEGEPQFGPLNVTFNPDIGWMPLSELEEDELQASIGLLQFTGSERLFAIDGQHRVAGIKKAVERNPELGEEEIAVIFVGHAKSPEGLARTRRLFTTLNKAAKRVSTADIVLLDEDNSFAITVRRLVNEFEAFFEGRLVRFIGSGSAIPAYDINNLTSIIAIYEVTQDLYGSKPIAPFNASKKALLSARHDEPTLDQLFNLSESFWEGIAKIFPDLHQVYEGTLLAGELRKPNYNHLLARPVGQRVVASAMNVLMSRGLSLASSLDAIAGVEINLCKQPWHHLLWDPVHEKILTTAKNRSLAETFLLISSGNEPRSPKHQSKYDEFLKLRDAEQPEFK
jgi:DNA sulfur modification protein DndB